MKINDLLKIDSNYTINEKQIIMQKLLNCDRSKLYEIEVINDKKIIKKYQKMIKSPLPISYLLKEAPFLSWMFYVNKDVLIPRFETEELVLKTDELLKKHFKKDVSICDIGCGSGVIGISLKLLNEESNITLTDISKKALKVAKKNSKIHNANVKFIHSDMLSKITSKYDILISNPPYLYENSDIEDDVLKYEPHIALYGGTKYYEEILKGAKNILNSKNIIAFEIGHDEKEEVIKLANKYFKDANIISMKDLNNFDRYIFILNNIA